MTEEVELQNEATERPRLSLQRRLGIVLSRDDHVSSDELRQLIEETETAAQAAHDKGQHHHDRCLSMDCDDLVAEKGAERAAMLERSRLEMVKPRLAAKLSSVLRRENTDRYLADRNRVAARADSGRFHA
jgi:hypothetical protein